MKHNIITHTFALAVTFAAAVTLAAQVPPGSGSNPAAIVALMQRVIAAHGAQWTTGAVNDWTATGTITYFTVAGPGQTLDLAIARKGASQVQRIVKQAGHEVRVGSDGAGMWDSLDSHFVSKAQGQAVSFIESQTTRSVPLLLNYQSQGLILRHTGQKGNAQLIESTDAAGRRTTFWIDESTSTVSKLEFVTAQTKDALGNLAVLTESYVFSGYRRIQGLLTPFRTERYFNGIKADEIRITSVVYNTSITDNAFRP